METPEQWVNEYVARVEVFVQNSANLTLTRNQVKEISKRALADLFRRAQQEARADQHVKTRAMAMEAAAHWLWDAPDDYTPYDDRENANLSNSKHIRNMPCPPLGMGE